MNDNDMITDSGVYLSNRMRRTRPSLRVVYLCAPLCSAPLSGAQARRHSTLSIPHSRSAGQAGIPIIVAMQRLHCPPCYVANRFGCGAPRCSAVLLLLLIQKSQPRRIHTSISTADVPTSYRRLSSLRTVTRVAALRPSAVSRPAPSVLSLEEIANFLPLLAWSLHILLRLLLVLPLPFILSNALDPTPFPGICRCTHQARNQSQAGIDIMRPGAATST